MTNTHFEGVCAGNPKVKFGRNKQKRNDCRQVAVGMAFDEFGLPLAHEVFEGNVADTTTLAALLDWLAHADCAGLKPVVVLDAGFASKANIALLRERHYSYLISITRNNRNKYAEFFEKEQFEELPFDFRLVAHRLQGKLFLAVGELDTNVDRASTMLVVNSFIESDKDFHLLVVPGVNHGAGKETYDARHRQDFFVRHLLGAEPRNNGL